jgi:hypothetical protein
LKRSKPVVIPSLFNEFNDLIYKLNQFIFSEN